MRQEISPGTTADRIRTLIFDLDGTISDPFTGIYKSINYALRSANIAPAKPDSIRPMIGPPLTEIFERLTGQADATHLASLKTHYRERYAKKGFRENTLYPRMPETISALAESGYRLGVCTSKRADYAAAILEMFGLSGYFDFVDGGQDGINKVQQLENLVSSGLHSPSSVMIGDRHFDIRAAKENNIRSVGVTWGFAEENEFVSIQPDDLVHSPDELLRLFA